MVAERLAPRPGSPDPGAARVRALSFGAGGAQRLASDRASLERLRDGGSFFWLDLERPEEEGIARLGAVFGFHPLALEDATNFGQRPKIDDYDGYVFLVVFGAGAGDATLAEVHCFYSERFLVTVHREACPSLDELRERLVRRSGEFAPPVLLLHRVVDGLVDGFFGPLSEIDDRIDALEDDILASPSDAQLKEVFELKRRLMSFRKAVGPQRDLFAKLVGRVTELPGMTHEAERYFRDVYDHLIRLTDLIDSYRDLLTGAMDVYLSTVSNRLNAVMKQLTLIATVFLPLGFLTGFFGQNFGWLVDRVRGPRAFVALGVALPLVVAGLLVTFFRRRGWLRADGPGEEWR